MKKIQEFFTNWRIKHQLKNENKVKKVYSERSIFYKIFYFFIFKYHDIKKIMDDGRTFEEYGFTIYCGKQGAGKTISMVEYLERMRNRYPDAIIITNFGYKNEDKALNDWTDLLTVRNGEKGVIFAIDEIQNEFNNQTWKNFPEWILREITQQRKQKIKIVATSQVFTRVVKQIREQAFEVVECSTFAKRWTIMRAFDAEEYNSVIDNPDKKRRAMRIWRRTFIQDDYIRDIFDSYAKVDEISKGDLKLLDRKDVHLS